MKHGKHAGKSRAIVGRAMREVHENEPSTVTRAQHFGPGGKEAMLRAIALSKARKAGAKIRRRPSGSGPMQDMDLRQGFRRIS